ncbi:MAG TPA: protein translocase subunit SecF [Longimicrobiales bacterium]|nr:protein translocase subunit SecF [Longimicrobiales bacterium]
MRRLFANAHYDFIGKRKLAYIISATALAVGLAAALIGQIRTGSWINYGVDFTGGTLVHVLAPGGTEGDIRAIVESAVPGSSISRFGDDEEFQIRTPLPRGEGAAESSDAVIDALRARYPGLDVRSAEAVGSKVGGEMQTRALLAILVSFVATLIYIAFRFEWRFGVAAIIATAHDILLTLGILAILRLEVSLPTVAAVLTIVGYSLNDTIIIFDRIRENLRGARRQEFVTILNRSINETLPRTVLTSVTTLVTLLSLFLFGGVIIRDFALILIVGILLGTYSSIFVAAPALLEIEKRFPHEQKQVRRSRSPAARPSRV